MTWNDETYRGDAYGAYGWGCDVAEVERDPDTYEVRPVRVTAVQDIGRAIHPVLAAGQIEGGTAQGIGYALLEEVVMRDGLMANAQVTNYIIPTTMDTPPIDTVHSRESVRARPLRRQGSGRDADRRARAGDRQRDPPSGRGHARNPGDAGEDHGGAGDGPRSKVQGPRSGHGMKFSLNGKTVDVGRIR